MRYMRSKAQAVLTAVRRFLPYFVGFNALAVAAQSRRSRSAAHSFEFQTKQRDKEEGKQAPALIIRIYAFPAATASALENQQSTRPITVRTLRKMQGIKCKYNNI